MSEKPAAEFGSYVDAKFMRGLKVMRVMVDIPIERSNEFLKVFGAPNGVDPVPVVIARLNLSGVSRAIEDGPSSTQGAAEPPPSVIGAQEGKRTRSQIAAYKLKSDPIFCAWLAKGGHNQERHRFETDLEYHDAVLKDTLGIDSKKELDTDEGAGDRWDRLETSFRFRDQVRS